MHDREVAGVRRAITWLHKRANEMNDGRAKEILNTAGFHLGVELTEWRKGARLPSPALDPATVLRDFWDDATNAVCQAMQDADGCNCKPGECIAAKISPGPKAMQHAIRALTLADLPARGEQP